jgi:hypothetical protein
MLGGEDEDAGDDHDGDENDAGGDEVHRLPLHDGDKNAARVSAGAPTGNAGGGEGFASRSVSFSLV